MELRKVQENDMAESTLDQVRLLEYLAPRIAQVVAGSRLAGPVLTLANAEARAEFLRVAMRLRTATQARGTP
jgi:hypothetical protein